MFFFSKPFKGVFVGGCSIRWCITESTVNSNQHQQLAPTGHQTCTCTTTSSTSNNNNNNKNDIYYFYYYLYTIFITIIIIIEFILLLLLYTILLLNFTLSLTWHEGLICGIRPSKYRNSGKIMGSNGWSTGILDILVIQMVNHRRW